MPYGTIYYVAGNATPALNDYVLSQIESIEDQIKTHLSAMGMHEMRAGVYRVRWMDVTSKRFDSKAFKNDHPEIYDSYLCPSTSKRFTVV